MLGEKSEFDHLIREGSYYFRGRKFFVKPFLEGRELQKYKEEIQKRRVFVHNIPNKMSNEDLGELFASFGDVEDSYIIRSNQSNKYQASSRKYGYVIFFTEEDASKAVRAKKITHQNAKLIILPFEKKGGAGPSNSEQTTPNLSPLEPERTQFANLLQNHYSTPGLTNITPALLAPQSIQNVIYQNFNTVAVINRLPLAPQQINRGLYQPQVCFDEELISSK